MQAFGLCDRRSNASDYGSSHKKIACVGQSRLHARQNSASLPKPRLDNDLCQVVVAKGSIVPARADRPGRSKCGDVGDVAAETARSRKNIKARLAGAGSSLQHICKITIDVINPHDQEAVIVLSADTQSGLPGLDRDRRLGAGPARMAG